MFGLAFEVKLSGASITWKDLSSPDGTTLLKLCLAVILSLNGWLLSAAILPLYALVITGSLSLQTKSNVNDLFFWSTLVALSGWSSDAQNYEFGIVRIELCHKLALANVIVWNNKLALFEGTSANQCNKIYLFLRWH